jgi:hypothetical protein
MLFALPFVSLPNSAVAPLAAAELAYLRALDAWEEAQAERRRAGWAATAARWAGYNAHPTRRSVLTVQKAGE